MALTSTGLTDIGQGAGLTTNFQVQYETTLPNQANVKANANALLAVVENEFTVTTGWFNTPSGKFGTGQRQVVNLNQADGSGAGNNGYGSAIKLDAQGGDGNAADAAARVEMLFMNEWVEILMSLSGGKWNAGDSMGEGLSQYCGIVRFQAGHYSYYNAADNRLFVETWMDTHPRQDWVTTTKGTDGDFPSFGCALAFIFYLNTQLNFSINQIIAAGAANLATVYQTLTGDNGNPYPFFASLLETVYPSSANANLPGPVFDNPFPLAELSFWMDKDTFGKDEVQDVINTSGGVWPKAFWLVVEGFSQDSFNALGVTIPAPTGSFANLTGVTITPKLADTDFENAANPNAPQRIRVPFDITFTSNALGDFPASGSQTYELDALLTIGGTKVPGSDASTLFELVAGADPYYTNIDPGQNNVFYLSQDLRVFTATPGQISQPVAGAPAFADDSVTGAYSYVQQLLTWLNDPNNHFTDGSTDPFASGVIPQPGDALQGNSSVTPVTVDMSNIFDIKAYNNYNFALARVRLRGPAGPSGAAPNVRVFFRLWSTQTADTDYQIGSTYPSNADAAGQPGSPLVGTDHHTLPFFASGNLSGNTDYGTGGANIRTLQINSGDSLWAYYGCFLNLYDSTYVIDGQPVQAWLNGTHHCLVAQIAFDGAPVIAGASPETSDKLAQRNLQVTLSDNPGPAATHRIPQTFDLRPSAPLIERDGLLLNRPDELMIDWGAIPAGSLASIFWPQVHAADVLALAARLYASHTLSAPETNTIQCKITGGVTYVPIPPGTGQNFAGLFTLELPPSVVTGQEYNVVVRRIATRNLFNRKLERGSPPLPAKGEKPKAARPTAQAEAVQARKQLPARWRYVVGTFQVKIPVATKEVMLRPEENTLAILKWRLGQMAPTNRWYRVVKQLIGYTAARVDGLGGDAGAILPSPNGVPIQGLFHLTEREYCGKVAEVLFDCYGDFEGFVLNDCDEMRTFKTRERGIGEIALRACKDRLLLCVVVATGHPHTIRRLAIKG